MFSDVTTFLKHVNKLTRVCFSRFLFVYRCAAGRKWQLHGAVWLCRCSLHRLWRLLRSAAVRHKTGPNVTDVIITLCAHFCVRCLTWVTLNKYYTDNVIDNKLHKANSQLHDTNRLLCKQLTAHEKN